MDLTDTHCHLNFQKFNDDREAVIQRARAAGVTRLLVPGLDLPSSREAVELAEKYPGIYAAVGFHPTDLDKFSESAFDEIRELARHPKVVAIGEIGLDHYWVKEEAQRKFQVDVLRRQLAFAAQAGKPVIIHMREAGDAWLGSASAALIEVLTMWVEDISERKHPLMQRPGVLHSFNGNLETAQQAVAMNFFIGVTGPVTYRNAEVKREIIRQIPLERLLIETDSPFLAPIPHRGQRNEPAFVREIADKIAEVKSRKPEEIAEITTANAARLFLW
ncbi:MAG: D-aminoacyl-tRNA deacylase [Anaerolineales bacterium]|nr:D-aminoacyl-tRNA deacylase [Anaerolineales bacterium]